MQKVTNCSSKFRLTVIVNVIVLNVMPALNVLVSRYTAIANRKHFDRKRFARTDRKRV